MTLDSIIYGRRYQNTLVLIFLVAVRQVLGYGADARIFNALNKGLYTELKLSLFLGQDASKINSRMRELICQNLPITQTGRDENMTKYTLAGLEFSFYGELFATTGEVSHFELRPYEYGLLLRYPSTVSPDVLAGYVDDYKLNDAYERLRTYIVRHGLSYAEDINNVIRAGRAKEMIDSFEGVSSRDISQIAFDIYSKGRRVVLISGPSSSGKTTFANRMMDAIEEVSGRRPLYLGTDDYFLNRTQTPRDENGEPNFEGLDAVDRALLAKHITGLIAGEDVDLPIFNFIDGIKEFGKRITKLKEHQSVVIEGIHALNDELTADIEQSLKYRIYISPLLQSGVDAHNRIPTTDLRLIRRSVRDARTRGRSIEVTISDWPKVRVGEEVNVFPYNGTADAVFNTAVPYEICVLKKHITPLLTSITSDSPSYLVAQSLLRILAFFDDIEDQLIPKFSTIREFIGGGIV